MYRTQLFHGLAVAALITTAPQLAFADDNDGLPQVVQIEVEKTFVPLGFDDNDNVEVIIHGHFRNTCYKVGPSRATIDHETKTVTIEPMAYKYSGVCAQLIVPFMQSISLGIVSEGGYQVVVKDQPDVDNASLLVNKATSRDPDDYLYAPVESAELGDDGLGHDTLVLRGNYPLMLQGCMVLREVRVTQTPGNVIVAQPIAEVVDGPECDSSRYSYKFQAVVKLPNRLAAGEYLVHVRILSASSVNHLAVVDR